MNDVKSVAYEARNDTFTVTVSGKEILKVLADTLLSAIKELGFDPKVVTAVKEPKLVKTGWPKSLPGHIQDALTKAQIEKKPILVDFYAEWCGPCKQMDRTVFPKDHVKTETSQWVIIRVDTDQYPEIAKSFVIGGLPTFMLLADKDRILDRKEGFQGADAFVTWLQSSRVKSN